MAATLSVLTQGGIATAATSFTTASVTRGTGRLQFLCFGWQAEAVVTISSVVDSNGLIWSHVNSSLGVNVGEGGYDYFGSPSTALYSAPGDGSSGTVTVTFSGPTMATWKHVEIVDAGYTQSIGVNAVAAANSVTIANDIPTSKITLTMSGVTTGSAVLAFTVQDTYSYTYDWTGTGWTIESDYAAASVGEEILTAFVAAWSGSVGSLSTTGYMLGTAIGVEVQLYSAETVSGASNLYAGTIGPGASVSFSATLPVGAMLQCSTLIDGSTNAVTSVSDNLGNAWTQVASQAVGASNTNMAVWRCIPTTGGAATITIDMGTSSWCIISLDAILGSGTALYKQEVAANTESTSETVTLGTLTASSGTFLAIVSASSHAISTLPSGFGYLTRGVGGALSTAYNESNTATSLTVTLTSEDYVGLIATEVFGGGSGGGGGSTVTQRRTTNGVRAGTRQAQ